MIVTQVNKKSRPGWHRERPAKSIIINGDANVKDCYISVKLSSPNRSPGQAADNAHRVAQAGFPVFPCREKDKLDKSGKVIRGAKSPLTTHGFKDATTDLAQVGSNARGRPGHTGRPRDFLRKRFANSSLSDRSVMQALRPVILPKEPRAQAGNPSCKRQ